MEQDNFITIDTLVQRNDKKFLANKLGEELVMMDMESGDFISMNNVGADIWSLSENPVSVREIIQQLLLMYNITEEQCTGETVHFLESSRGQNIFLFPKPATV